MTRKRVTFLKCKSKLFLPFSMNKIHFLRSLFEPFDRNYLLYNREYMIAIRNSSTVFSQSFIFHSNCMHESFFIDNSAYLSCRVIILNLRDSSCLICINYSIFSIHSHAIFRFPFATPTRTSQFQSFFRQNDLNI